MEAPIVDVSTGVRPRMSLGLSMPVCHDQDPTGGSSSGLGAISLFAKFRLVGPDDHRVGVAFSPLIQIDTQSGATDRVGATLPISIETRLGRTRAYGSTGVSTRGAVFGSGALEIAVADRTTVTGTLAHSYAMVATGVPIGDSPHRTDVSVAVGVRVSAAAAFFTAVGHAYSGATAVDGGPWIAGGISIRVARH
jgi:hypothetical protein